MAEVVNNAKQQELMDAAGKLFYKYGIRRVTVAEICQEAGVSKMTFYKYYSNKADLAKAYLANMMEKSVRDYREVMTQDIHFSEKVKKLILLKLRDTEGISKEFMQDALQDQRLQLFDFIAEKRQEFQEEILRDFKRAARSGQIRAGIKPEFITYFMNKISTMATDESLLALYQNEQALIMELTQFFFYGLGIRDENQ